MCQKSVAFLTKRMQHKICHAKPYKALLNLWPYSSIKRVGKLFCCQIVFVRMKMLTYLFFENTEMPLAYSIVNEK